MTEHLLKTPDERKQPSRATSASTSTKGASIGAVAFGKGKDSGEEESMASKRGGARAKWAVTELLDVSDFDALVPQPAYQFPFTLDGFQKQAVARLEVRSKPTTRRADDCCSTESGRMCSRRRETYYMNGRSVWSQMDCAFSRRSTASDRRRPKMLRG